jgi:hypothetical protein
MNLASGYELGSSNVVDITVDMDTRLRSAYCIGSSGSGKSSMLEIWVVQDIQDNVGFTCFDVEDRLSVRVLRHLRDAGREPVVIDPTLGHLPLNILYVPPGIHPHTVVEGVLQAFKRAWFASWGERLEDLLRHSLMLLQERGLTLGELPRLLSNHAFRERVAESSQDERCHLYFLDHLRNVPQREWRVWVESTRNKVAAFMDNPFLAPSLSCEGCLDFTAIMDDGVPLIVNLPEAKLGDSGKLFGMLIVSKLFQGALRRKEGARPHIIYADEFQNFATRSFLDLVTRSRKRGVGSVLAHQTTHQPPFDQNPEFLSAILGTTAIHVVMQVGREDAERFAKEVFTTSGTAVKRRQKQWPWGDVGEPKFYSVQEEREMQMQELERQRQRESFIKIRGKDQHRVYVAEAYDLPEPVSTKEEAQTLAAGRVEALGVPLEAIQGAQEARIAKFSPGHRLRRPTRGVPLE